MGDRKLFLGSPHYTRYTEVISELIKEHEQDLASYEKVENLGTQSVIKGEEYVCAQGELLAPLF